MACLLCLALALALTSAPFSAYAETAITPNAVAADNAEQTTVRVAVFPDGNYMAPSEDGLYGGYNIDYLATIALKANWRYEYVAFDSWMAASAALERGEVDLLPSVRYTAQRENSLLLSQSSVAEIYTTINVRIDDSRFAYEDFEAFRGMTVGIIEGSQDAASFAQYCQEHQIAVFLVYFKNTDELTKSLKNGSLDAIAVSDLGHVANLKTVERFSPEPVHVALAKNQPALLEELDQAISLIKFRNPDYFSTLYEKYFGVNTAQDPVFTREEYRYLETAPKLRVAYTSFRTPLSYRDPSTGNFTGIAAELFADITRITGLEFEFVPVDSQQKAVNMTLSGEVDVTYAIDPALEDAENKIPKTGLYLYDPMAMVTRNASGGNRVALPQGFSLSEEIVKDDPSLEVTYYPTPKLCFDAVSENKADIAYADINVANYLLAEPQYNALSILTLSDYMNSMAIGVAPNSDPVLVGILDKCVQFTADATMTQWITKSTLNSHPTSPLDILRQYPLQIILGILVLALGSLATMAYIFHSKIRNKQQIAQLVNKDPLTGGWSFAKFQDRASTIIEQDSTRKHAILYVDINRFKSFNAAFGFAEGDRLLIALGDLLHAFIAEDECFARVSADQFVVLIQWDSFDAFMTRFKLFDEHFNNLELLKNHKYQVLLRGGVGVISAHTTKTEQLISEFIDCARYARESIGESSCSTAALYSEDMRERDIAERALQTEAVAALERGEFVAYYQPKVHIGSGEIIGFEALVRWVSAEKGLRAPNEFIPLFEKNGFITQIDLHVFELACRRIRECLDAGLPIPLIACNFSRLHLQNDQFPETLEALVHRYRVPVDHLELELTENIVMEDFERAETICTRLKKAGFRIAIDDFGKGYSSLGTLQDLPIDVLKLDSSFLMDSANASKSKIILEGIIGIAEKMGVTIVAEGVETPDQAAMLHAMNPQVIAQGFLYSRPVTREESDQQLAAKFMNPQPPR
ncbi:MAG: EAL domain-containing protein [Raoultibacter sp.]